MFSTKDSENRAGKPRKSLTLEVNDSHFGVKQVNFTKGNRVFVQDGATGLSEAVSFVESLLIARANDYCKNVYRSHAGIIRENLRQKRENRYVIHPYSAFRWYWNLMIVAILAVILTGLPVQIAFFSNEGEQDSFWVAMNATVDIIFIIDTLLNFRTGYLEAKTEVIILKNQQIILHYLKTWFIIDFLSSVPFDLIYEASIQVDSESIERELNLLRYSKALSLLRLMRIVRLLRYIRELEVALKIDGTILSIVHLILVTVFFIHWNACLQYLVAFIEGFPPESWVAKYNLLRADSSTVEKYGFSLYRSVAHMLGMGYGQHTPPTTLTELWIGMTCYVLGGTFYALFIAHVSNLIMSMNLSGRKYEEKPEDNAIWSAYSFSAHRSISTMLRLEYDLDDDTWQELALKIFSYILGRLIFILYLVYLSIYVLGSHNSEAAYRHLVAEVKEYMRFRKVPPSTQSRVMNFYERMYQKKYFDERSILFEPNMSPILRNEILMHNCRQLVMKVSFLKEAPMDFLCEIIAKLQFHVYFPDDVIIKADTRGVAMYFIEHGEVEVKLMNTDYAVKTLTDGDFFGEIALLLDQKTTASIVSSEISDVYRLSRFDFNEVLDNHPTMKSVLHEEALARLRESQLTEVPAHVEKTDSEYIASLQSTTHIPDIQRDEHVPLLSQTHIPQKDADVYAQAESPPHIVQKESKVSTQQESRHSMLQKESDVYTQPKIQTNDPKGESDPANSQDSQSHFPQKVQFDSLSRLQTPTDNVPAENIS